VTGTRERILAATNESFRRRGFHATSLKQITAAAGVPTGSVYHFFPAGKDELAREVVVTSGEAYRQLFEMIADEAGDVSSAVVAFFEGAAAVLEETDYLDPCPIGTVAREVASTNDALRAATAHVFASWVATLRERLQRDGVAPDEARSLATTLVAALEGGFVLARASRDASQLRAVGESMRELVDRARTRVASAEERSAQLT